MNYVWLILSCSLVVALFFRLLHLIRAIQSRNWASIEGKIIESSIRRVKLRSPKYLPKIVYEYSIEGISYISNQLSFSEYMRFYRSCQGVIDRYPAGKSVTVYYDPKNPKNSVIQKGRIKSAILLFLLTMILTVYVLWFDLYKGYFAILHS